MIRTFRVAHRLSVPILAVTVGLAAVACGGTDSDRSGSNGGDEEAAGEGEGNGGGAPFQGGDGDGVGAPFMIPAISQVGAPYPEVKDSIQQTFVDACGTPELCVVLSVEDRPIEGEPCAFDSTDPPGGTEIERGSTVTLVVVAPCPGGSPPPDEESDGEAQGDETLDEESQD